MIKHVIRFIWIWTLSFNQMWYNRHTFPLTTTVCSWANWSWIPVIDIAVVFLSVFILMSRVPSNPIIWRADISVNEISWMDCWIQTFSHLEATWHTMDSYSCDVSAMTDIDQSRHCDISTVLSHLSLCSHKPNAFLLCAQSKTAVFHYSFREGSGKWRNKGNFIHNLSKPGSVKDLPLCATEYDLTSTTQQGKDSNAVFLLASLHKNYA